ncbi:MAG: hypothetical protein AAGF68_06920 [Pseudomonadota bacterium]
MKRSPQILLLWAAFFATAALADEAVLTLPESAASAITLTVGEGSTDLSPEDILRVYVGAAAECCAGQSPIAGRYSVTDGVISFEPAFDFLEGYPYTVATWQRELAEFVVGSATPVAPPEVLAIYPSGPSLPENTLRFYIEFSVPMMPHRAEEFINLVDAQGRTDDQAFMSFTQELWNADRTTLTLLMDPGRIKRGVAQNLTLGPALEEEQSYLIVVDPGWPAANGLTVAPGFERPFSVGAALRNLPSAQAWEISTYEIGTREPISITFDRPFDRFQTLSSITIVEATTGTLIEGVASLGDDEQSWRFAPSQPWGAERLHLVVDARLEDVAGNNFRDTLDHTLETETRQIDEIIVPLTARP